MSDQGCLYIYNGRTVCVISLYYPKIVKKTGPRFPNLRNVYSPPIATKHPPPPELPLLPFETVAAVDEL